MEIMDPKIIVLRLFPPDLIIKDGMNGKEVIEVGELEAIQQVCLSANSKLHDLAMDDELGLKRSALATETLLEQFASVGRSVYDAVFPSEKSRAQITRLIKPFPDAKIIVHGSDNLWIPWEIIYDGDDSDVLSSRFWGVRYAILRAFRNPENLKGSISSTPNVDLSILKEIRHVQNSEHPFLVNLNNRNMIHLHPQSWNGQNKGAEIDRFRKHFTESPVDIAHFACLLLPVSCLNKSYLVTSDSFFLDPDDFLGLKFRSTPLVILNFRDNSKRFPLHVLDHIRTLLYGCGAIAAVVNEFATPDALAAEFAHRFYDNLLQNSKDISEAVHVTRQQLINESMSLFSLGYALYVLDPNVTIEGPDVKSRVTPNLAMSEWSSTRQIGHRKYELLGTNWEICSFLANKDVLSSVLESTSETQNRVYKSLAGREYGERVGETKKLMSDLWHRETGLAPYLFIDTLSEFEFDRTYYPGYRDHVTHQFRVYLLGLYLYYGSPILQEAMKREFKGHSDVEAAFLLSWKIASFFHDVGYVFEVEDEKRDRTHKRVFEQLNEFFDYPLFAYCQMQNLPLLKPEERAIRKAARVYGHKVGSFRDLGEFLSINLFDEIENLARPARLCQDLGGVARYYRYAMSNKPKDRVRASFIDHGIAGALLLVHLHRFFLHYLESVALEIPKNVLPAISEKLIGLRTAVDGNSSCIAHAAAAIALHNINVDLWDKEDAFRTENLTLHQYELSLEQTPLAFMLALVDVLQDWDRPLFSVPSETGNYVSQDQDFSITFSGKKIMVDFLDDEFASTPGSRYNTLIEELRHYLRNADIDSLLTDARGSASLKL